MGILLQAEGTACRKADGDGLEGVRRAGSRGRGAHTCFAGHRRDFFLLSELGSCDGWASQDRRAYCFTDDVNRYAQTLIVYEDILNCLDYFVLLDQAEEVFTICHSLKLERVIPRTMIIHNSICQFL